MRNFIQLIPGIIIVMIITIIAICISETYTITVMLIALLLGISCWFFHRKTRCKTGIEFTASKVLRFGVALIGLRIAFWDILAIGWELGALLIIAVTSTVLLGLLLAKIFGVSKQFWILSGWATGICWASAALAISSVLPESKQKEQDTLLTIIWVTVLSTIAMILYPMIATWLHLNGMQSSVFLGWSIHDVAQVVGAGYSISPKVWDMAVLTKLVRVSFLVPVVLAILFVVSYNNKSNSQKRATIFPFFLSAFIALMVLNSIIQIPAIITDSATMISKYALIAAITAIGMKTNLKQLLHVWYKPLIILTLEALWIASVFLVYFSLFYIP